MMILARWVLSLFITGDKGSHIFNPMAALMVGGALFLGYQVLTLKSQNYELMRQINVVQEAKSEKVRAQKEARNEKEEAVEIINSGKFDNDYLGRLQQSD